MFSKLFKKQSNVIPKESKGERKKEVLLAEGAQGRVYEVNEKTIRKVYSPQQGQEFADLIENPNLIVAEGEITAWNKYYTALGLLQYATARMDADGSLLLPKIPGTPADKLASRPANIDVFKNEMSELMHHLCGKYAVDRKDADIFVSKTATGKILFLPVDFGEYGMLNLFDRYVAASESLEQRVQLG